MKRYFLLTLAVLFVCAGFRASAQVTNLKVNGASANFTTTQGDSLTWEYNLPTGGTATGEIWIDLNGNGSIDPLTDKLLFGNFQQTDGQYMEDRGPGDLDSLANGHIFFGLANNGSAPAMYVFRFTHDGAAQTVGGTVAPLPSPAYTVSGNIVPPPGRSAQNILVATSGEDGGTGWMALTDASGNYTINLNATVGGTQQSFRVEDDFAPYIAVPAETTLMMSQSYTGVNFTYLQPSAKVVGYLKGEDGYVFANMEVYSSPWNQFGGGGDNERKMVMTDENGFYQFGYSLGDIASHPTWQLESHVEERPFLYFPPQSGPISIHANDSLRVDLTALVTDDSIKGTVTIDGHAPNNQSFNLYAGTQDSGNTYTSSDPATGNFTFYVTKKIYNYYLNVEERSLPEGYGYDNRQPEKHPGDRGIVINLVKLAWQRQTSTTNNTLNALSFVNATTGWVAGWNGTVLHTTDGGGTWTQQTTNTGNTINGIFFVNDSMGWIVGNNGTLKATVDGGATWTAQNSTTSNDLNAVQFIDATTGWAVCAGVSGTKLLRTTNGGTTWASSSTGTGDLFSLSFANANTGWAVGYNGTIIKTTDGGLTWNAQSVTTGCKFTAVQFIDAEKGWAVNECNESFHTTDGGSNWMAQGGVPGPCGLRGISFLDSTTGFVAGGCGAIAGTGNGGATWENQFTNANGNLNAVQFIDAHNGWAVGDNGMILYTEDGTVTSAMESGPGEQPTGFMLAPNFPNPFNPTTHLQFTIVNVQFVSLKVYNVLGVEVATLVNEKKEPGDYTVAWNAAGMPSGVYYYRLDASSVADPTKHFSQTRKMSLVK